MPKSYHPTLQEWIEENLASGQICPSNLPHAVPMFFKDEGDKLHLIINYHWLNEITVKDAYPLLLICKILDSLAGSQVFSKFDIQWGFHNICIREGNESKAAFICPLGQYEPTMMQFGLSNAPLSFQRFMDNLLAREIATGKVLVYVDDILIHMQDLEDHCHILNQVLSCLQEHCLTACPAKCAFEQDKVTFLGVKVSHGLIWKSAKRCSGICDWPTPCSKTELQRFLGLTNYYH